MTKSQLRLVCSLILKARRREHFVRCSKMIQWHFSLARKDFHGLLFRKIIKLCGVRSIGDSTFSIRRVAAITTKQSDPESTHKRPGDFFEVAENRNHNLPASSGVRVRRRTLHHGLYDMVNFWNPFGEPVPVLLQNREPRK
jgi:hypothetical protein